jgi:hypothetical protein
MLSSDRLPFTWLVIESLTEDCVIYDGIILVTIGKHAIGMHPSRMHSLHKQMHRRMLRRMTMSQGKLYGTRCKPLDLRVTSNP